MCSHINKVHLYEWWQGHKREPRQIWKEATISDELCATIHISVPYLFVVYCNNNVKSI